jgi:5-formyltetrahydrofolate cyclo-ligase
MSVAVPGSTLAVATFTQEFPMPDDPQTRKAAIREQARKNRVAQKNKDEISRAICGTFMALPAYQAAKTVMWYVDRQRGPHPAHAARSPHARQERRRAVVRVGDEHARTLPA